VPDTQFHLLGTPGAPAAAGFDAYRKQGGYTALQRAVTTMSPDQVLAEVHSSGLRGRGGAGVLTAEKLTLVAQSAEDAKYLICNAYDADPRSLIARTLLASSPHLVIEGMALAAYAVGAAEAFLFMRGERQEVAETVHEALREAQEHGIVGRGVLGSRFNFTITVAGADMGFMAGEETALIQILKGRPMKAQQRPPYPTDYGIFDKPTIMQNVETLANLPAIVTRGGDAFRRIGTPTTSGTKLFTVIGPKGGAGVVVEVAVGATIAEALRAAGIVASEATARAVSVGGMEGGVLPLSHLNTPLDFEPLEDAGTIMGSSVIEVLPVGACLAHWAMARADYLSRETCGKCVPCRVGVKRVAGTLQGISSGIGVQGDLALLEEFAHYIPDGSLCGFGVNAMHPVVTAMKYFADDFSAHLEGRCPTGECAPVRAHRYVTKHVL
jgi:NADH:ubiquinone oxidoreductase subunit F (NADH-binding)